jgi:hypothetical protein
MEKAFGFNMKTQETVSHPFAQQKLPAWQPLISTRMVVVIMLCIAIICLPLGIGLLVTSYNVCFLYQSPFFLQNDYYIFRFLLLSSCSSDSLGA